MDTSRGAGAISLSVLMLAALALPSLLTAQPSGTWESNGAAAWTNRTGHAVVEFDNRVWVLGGHGDRPGAGGVGLLADVWSSVDGENWTEELSWAPWPARFGHAVVVHDNRLWLLGGSVGSSSIVNQGDVWSSADGVNWVEEPAGAPWSARFGHAAVSFQGRLWVLGGYAIQGGQSVQNDVWSSADGVSWTLENAAAPWSKRHDHSVVVHDSRMWVIGGAYHDSADVWWSVDGSQWTLETDSPPWVGTRQHVAAVFNGRIWLLGGNGNGGGSNAVWSSDGTSWVQETPAAVWRPRIGHGVAVFLNRIWVLGGNCSTWDGKSWQGNPEWQNDVWSSATGAGGGYPMEIYANGFDPNVVVFQGLPLAATFKLVAHGGAGPYSWAIVNGSLPEAFALGTPADNIVDVILSGKVAKKGAYAFTVQVFDAAGQSITRNYEMHVQGDSAASHTGGSLDFTVDPDAFSYPIFGCAATADVAGLAWLRIAMIGVLGLLLLQMHISRRRTALQRAR